MTVIIFQQILSADVKYFVRETVKWLVQDFRKFLLNSAIQE